jgi:HAD superfamily hydrolase (TIGR01509 family)
MTVRHIIFDCDGVLVDSELISSDHEEEIARRLGITMDPAEMHRRFLGRTAREQWSELAEMFGIDLPADFHLRRVRDAKDVMSRRLKAVAGVPETLPRLSQTLSCASNSERVMLEHKLEVVEVRHYFGDRIVSFEDVARPKPAPDMYLEAVRRSGLPASAAIVVEDTPTGASAALAAGIPFIGFIGGEHTTVQTAAELNEMGPLAILEDFRKLPELIAQL